MKSLTSKQKKVLDFISDFIEKKNQSPTVEEIRSGLDFKSSRSVSQYLEALVEKRYITKTGDARSIKLVDCNYEEVGSDTTLLPLYGLASCGTPEFYADDNVEDYISVDKKLLKGDEKNFYLVRASGSSMNKEIEDSSLVLLEKKDYYDEKENILAIVDEKAVIKKIFRGNSGVLLMPSSTDKEHKPIVASEDLYIAGRVICSIPDPTNLNELQYVKEEGVTNF
ncbi:MAG: transcriptional repressor LexA [Candidatus Moranbacteria bacterium]|nr:transcriptional repressor LexA [Candidatus Moranbacteria bacterium]